jgi:hypothetical protein
VAQEKAHTFQGKKIDGQFLFTRDKAVYVNHYYFYIDDADFGPLFIKVCSYAPWAIKVCLNGQERAERQMEKKGIAYEALDNGFLSRADADNYRRPAMRSRPKTSSSCSGNGWRGFHCRCGRRIAPPDSTGACPSGRWK